MRRKLSYDGDTGLFLWEDGQKAGTVRPNGYIQIYYEGKFHLAHRLAWFLTYGVWPQNNVDHINGERVDNRIANLREATSAQNCANRRKAQGHSVMVGINWDVDRKKWRVWVGGKLVGRIGDLIDAVALRIRLSRELYGEFSPC